MIVGVFLRHYKCYRNLHFIPFITNHNHSNLNLIIGKNGSGKTSILEILDVYFNKKSIVLSHEEKRGDAYIAPIICIEKSFIEKIKANYTSPKSDLEEIIKLMSDALWDLKAPSNSKQQYHFQELRDNFHSKYSKETHYLLVDGINIDGDIKLGPFEELQKIILETCDKKKLIAFSNALKSSYNYIYIPVETNINDYLRLENNSLQYLIGQDIKTKIDDVFDKQVTVDGSNKKIIQIINDNLKEFVSSVEKTIQKIDKDYSFNTDPNVKQKVTSKDLRGRVIEEYFKNRSLKNKDTKINSMSSGQRKKALIDIIFSLVTENSVSNSESNIILGIDEPEASLDVTNCFEQFEKIEKISQQNIQTLVTTHWYGALPIINDAIITHTIEDERKVPQISCFASNNLFDNHEAHRVEDIFFKSIYDLASAILSSLRNGNKDWIIVEGHSDKIYLQSYFNSKNVKFLSIGGIDRLISLVDFLSVPLRNKTETEYTKNKIIFLSDNDMEYKSSLTENSKILFFKRYVFKEGEVKLIDYIDNKHGEEIRIEDVLESNRMWSSLNNLANEIPELRSVLNNFNIAVDFKISKLSGDYSFIETEKKGKEKLAAFKELIDILKPLKTRLAHKYNELPVDKTPEWISELKKLLKPEPKLTFRSIKKVKPKK
ncbi:AAA family ATPase [Flavobacterium sp. UBA6135]|uniref:AAA family ATPase n=1 Tax=Flavobacterium sp. UBA6135 TaxID=1946553 RepID=UPI0025C02095|nr:AAA family ATPase [Flavobacterium sp. UBA6135]